LRPNRRSKGSRLTDPEPRASSATSGDLETQPAERHKLLLSLFEQVWAHEEQIVAVQPHDAFLPYFEAAEKALGGERQGVESGVCT